MGYNKEKFEKLSDQLYEKYKFGLMPLYHSLFQWLEKEHLDPDNNLSDDEWEIFVEDCQNSFGNEVSEVGKEFLENWISDGHLERYREEMDETCL